MGNTFMKAFIVLALSILQTTVCYADTFKGKVVNAETGEVIVGARVESEINPQPGWSIQSTTETDSTGCISARWTIPMAGR